MGGRRRTLWSSLLVIGTITAVAGSGVFAIISDGELSGQNRLRGGSIDLRLDGGDGSTTFRVEDSGPGKSGSGKTRLSNVGSNDGGLTAKIEEGGITNAPGMTYESEPTPDEGELGQVAEMWLFLDRNRNGIFDGNDSGLSSTPVDAVSDECVQYAPPSPIWDTFDSYEGCVWSDLATLGPDADFVVHWRIPDDAGNEIQGDQVYVSFTFRLDQVS